MASRKSGENVKDRARVDALDVKIGDLRDRVSELEKASEKVRKMSGLPATMSGIHRRLDGLEKDWKWVFKAVGKAEADLSDVKARVLDNEKLRERFELNEESMHELMKVLDDIDGKLEAAATEKRVNGAFEELMGMVHAVGADAERRITDLSASLEDLKASVRRTEPFTDKSEVFRRMFVPRKEFEGLKEELALLREGQQEGLEKRFGELVREAERHIHAGRMDAAKVVYGDALRAYRRLASGGGESNGMLEKMNSLYESLRA